MNVTRLRLPAIRRAVQDTLWAIQPEKLEQMLAVVELHAGGGGLSAEEIRANIGAGPRATTVRAQGAIAVLPLYGIVAQRMNFFMQFSGGTSTELFGRDFDALINNPDIGAIVIDIDSPGGAVSGTPELATKIHAARGTKPIIAVCNSLMCSAAYWIGSAADEIVATPSSDGVGSIGVVMVHEEISRMAEDAGVKFTVLRAPEHKAEGNPYEPLAPETQEFWQAQIDEIYGMFANAVAKHREVSVKVVREDYGRGRALTAKQAKAAGMIDRIATLDEVIAKLGGGKGAASRARSGPATMEGGKPVSGLLLADDDVDAPIECKTCGGDREKVDGEYRCRKCEPEYFDDETEDDEGAGASEAATTAETPASQIPTPAPQGQETPVSVPTTAAPPGAPSASDILAAERARVVRVNELCAQEGMPQLAAELIASGANEDQVATRLLQERRKQHAGAPHIQVGADRAAERPFETFGEQIRAIVRAGKSDGRIVDPRLTRINEAVQRMAGPSGMSEGLGSDGGFFIQPELLPGVIDPVYTEDPILSRVTRIPIGAGKNAVKYNVVDETARTTGSRWGGIQAYWVPEAETAPPKAPKLRQMQLDLKKLMGLAYLTEELQEDAPASEALLTRAFQAELQFMLGAAIFAGTGAGQPLGFMNSGALVSQAIEATQTIANSDTFIAKNVSKMLSRIPASLWGEVIWLYNQELLPTLVTATIGTGQVPVFIGAGGLANRPQDTILGRPAFGSELCEAVGTPGDILALVPSQYHMADKGGPKQAISLHVRFVYDEQTLKITYRVDGAPVWRSSVTPYKGSNARSPFVALATRS